jgi:vacuolar-type H+-ATPase subunit I/STV1
MRSPKLRVNIMDTEKSKRKETAPNLHRYWLIIGTLFVLLVFMLRYPIHIISYWILNPIIYGLLTLALLVILLRFVRQYTWQHSLTIILICSVFLAAWQTISSPRQSPFDEYCTVINEGLIETRFCGYIGNCPTILLKYVGISGLPFAIETIDYYENPCLSN